DLSASGSNTSLAVVGVFQLMLLLGLLLLIFIRIRKVLLVDAEHFNNFAKQLLLSGNQNVPNYAFDLFRFLSLQLIGYSEKVPRGRSNDVRTPEGKRDDVSINPIFQNKEVLDVDINEDDNLFGSTVPPAPAPVTPAARAPTPAVEPMEFTVGPKLPAEIFRAYDIRGTFGQTLKEDYAYTIGQAIGSEVLARGENTVIAARDGRTSSPVLQQALMNGLVSAGCDVLDIGEVPTPVLYFATHVLNAQSGVMVTGSHNPPDHNGFKIVIGGETLSGEQIQNLRRRIEKGQFNKGDGYQQKIDVLPEYVEKIVSSAVLARPLKVVLDCGNGVGGKLAPHILAEMGCKVVELFCEVDGRFPNHQPDPSQPENLKALQAAVIANEADIGIALDGDADRIGVVTNRGTIIWPDRLLMLYARDLLARNPGADVIFDVKCSRDLADLVSASGGRPIMWKSGHSLMKAKMRETGALLGGELSGHIFFADQWFGFDDGIYAAARLLEILSMEPIDAEEIFAEFPAKVSTPEYLIKLPETAKFSFMQRLENSLQFKDGKLITIDGVRVDFPYGWGLVRASNTTASLTARFEAETEDALKDIERRFREQLLAVDPSLQLPF
ncbi:MAG TPA: phosphomannomutase/phosphoglucomutase, partial [Pseudomonadales bacterium]|nr:phosphomannomutase/phosphoglucomutase [Pseudomonadales bacterium]